MNNDFKNWYNNNKDKVCPYAHLFVNSAEIIDGDFTIDDLKNISKTSIVLTKHNISNNQLEQETNNKYFSYDGFVLVIPANEYLIAQRELYEDGYYNDKDKTLQHEIQEKFNFVYPIKKRKNQTLGTETRYKIYEENFKEPGSVLDVGGAAANLFYHNIKTIEKYSCLDVKQKNILIAKEMYPNINFYHWNRFNYMYNPDGVRDLKFPIVELHDYSFINSVFPCTDLYDMIYILKEVKKVTKKKILFTFFSNTNIHTLESFYNSFSEDEKRVDIRTWSSYNNNIFYLLNNDIEILDKDKVELDVRCDFFLSAYNVEYLQARLENELGVKITKQDPCIADNHFTAFIINLEKET